MIPVITSPPKVQGPEIWRFFQKITYLSRMKQSSRHADLLVCFPEPLKVRCPNPKCENLNILSQFFLSAELCLKKVLLQYSRPCIASKPLLSKRFGSSYGEIPLIHTKLKNLIVIYIFIGNTYHFPTVAICRSHPNG